MPGPSNKKKKQKGKGKEKRKLVEVDAEGEVELESIARKVEEAMFEPPFIHDPGNGPRVRDVKLFLQSSFAQPVADEDELCREFGRKEVLEMLTTILPEEPALILWYNKSRAKSRICPSCLRLYNVGDKLPDHISGGSTNEDLGMESGRQKREQELSGICSPVCFVVAAFDFAEAIKSAWGHTGDEMSDWSWAALNKVVIGGDELKTALGLVVKMTRLDDLGLLELCFE